MPFKNGNPPNYTVWRSMLDRCYNPKSKQYKDYGGRGIRVCPQWRDNFKQFAKDMKYRPPGTSIERLNNDIDYTPDNCVWGTKSQQQRNRRNTVYVTIEGKNYLAVDLSHKHQIKTDTIIARAAKNMTLAQVTSKEKFFNLEGFKLGAAVSSKVRKQRTHCKNGHEFTTENTRIDKQGKYSFRVCRVCHREGQHRRTRR